MTAIETVATLIGHHSASGSTPRHIAQQLHYAGMLRGDSGSTKNEDLETLRSLCHIATTNGFGLTDTVNAYLALTKETS